MKTPSLIPGAAAALALVLAACRITTVERFAPPAHVPIEETSASRTWDVLADEETVGRVVEFRSDEPEGGVQFVVQNVWRQDLGLIDELGRAWRFHPHQTEAEWLLTGTIAEGAAAILGAGSCELREVPLEQAREAAAGR